MDDIGGLADWAMLKPNAFVFSLAAVPVVLEDDNDAERLWDRIRTKALLVAVNVFPDSILQVILMANYFTYTIGGMSDFGRAQFVFSLFCTAAVSFKTAIEL